MNPSMGDYKRMLKERVEILTLQRNELALTIEISALEIKHKELFPEQYQMKKETLELNENNKEGLEDVGVTEGKDQGEQKES